MLCFSMKNQKLTMVWMLKNLYKLFIDSDDEDSEKEEDRKLTKEEIELDKERRKQK